MTTPKSVEEIVEHVASVCDDVEFLRGVPVKLPSDTKAMLRGRIREALTTCGNARYEEGVKAERERVREWAEKEGGKVLSGNSIRVECHVCKEEVTAKDSDILWRETDFARSLLAFLPDNTK